MRVANEVLRNIDMDAPKIAGIRTSYRVVTAR